MVLRILGSPPPKILNSSHSVENGFGIMKYETLNPKPQGLLGFRVSS